MRCITPQRVVVIALIVWLGAAASAVAQEFDLLLRGGRVIDPRNSLKPCATWPSRMDGLPGSRRASRARALKTIDVSGLYVLPGLIDMHAHVPATAGPKFGADNNAVFPDGFSFSSGVTTSVDPGGAGWRNFEDMKARVIDRSRTRVLAFINIVGRGMAGATTNRICRITRWRRPRTWPASTRD